MRGATEGCAAGAPLFSSVLGGCVLRCPIMLEMFGDGMKYFTHKINQSISRNYIHQRPGLELVVREEAWRRSHSTLHQTHEGTREYIVH